MQPRRWSLSIGIALLLVGSLGLLFYFLVPRAQPPPVNTRLEVFSDLELGMTEEEVEGVLGGPAGDYTTERYQGSIFAMNGPVIERPDDYQRRWVTDEGEIWVWFNRKGEAVEIRRGHAFLKKSWLDDALRYLRSLLP